jgi:hypothetical protein
MRQFFRDLAALVKRMRADLETRDQHIARNADCQYRSKMMDLMERQTAGYRLLLVEAKRQSKSLERIAVAAEKLAEIKKPATKPVGDDFDLAPR